MRLVVLLGLAWLASAALFLGWAAREVWRDHREEQALREIFAELRQRERGQAALRRMGGER